MSPEIRANGGSDALPTNECDHYVGIDASGYLWPVSQMGKDWVVEADVVAYKFTYCPDCGEKL